MAGTGTAHLRRGADDIALSIEELNVEFDAGRHQRVHAVSGISFDVRRGETVGIVGESGCGKSSTGRAIMQLPPPTSGRVIFDGMDLTTLPDDQLRATRSRLQMIFQDPISSLNPRRKVRDIVAEGLDIWGKRDGRKDRVDTVLREVGLDPAVVGDRRPSEFSGGQCQRICVARALVMKPEVVILDEPVSALDVSVQAQLLNLLEEMKRQYSLTMIFIAHDLAVIKNVSDRIVVMYLGKICEIATPDVLFSNPRHPYTALLMSSILEPGPRADDIPTTDGPVGEIPSVIDPPSGCRFRTRCPHAQDLCATAEPEVSEDSQGSWVACHFPLVSGI